MTSESNTSVMDNSDIELISYSELEQMDIHQVDLETYDPEVLWNESRKLAQYCDSLRGLGLSACQVGIPYAYFVFNPNGDYHLVINPLYRQDRGRHSVVESCLSCPDEQYMLKRYKRIQIEYWTIEDGKYIFVTGKLHGPVAQIFQHEADHCNGVTIAMKGKRYE